MALNTRIVLSNSIVKLQTLLLFERYRPIYILAYIKMF